MPRKVSSRRLKCSIKGCERWNHGRVDGKPLCVMHYSRVARGKPIGEAEPQTHQRRGATCMISGCMREVKARSLCGGCYERVRRGATVEQLNERATCEVCVNNDCNNTIAIRSRQWCQECADGWVPDSTKFEYPAELASHAKNATDWLTEHQLIPCEQYRNAQTNWLVACIDCNQKHESRLSDMKKRKHHACKHCNRRLATQSAQLSHDDACQVMLENGLTPLEQYRGNQSPWHCQCQTCLRDVWPLRNDVQQGMSRGCKFCARQAYEADDAYAAMSNAGFRPLVPYPGATAPWLVSCNKCGGESEPTLTRVVGVSPNCGWCTGAFLDEDHAVEVMLEAGAQPITAYPGNNKKPWKSQCTACEKIIYPCFNNIDNGQGACVYCKGLRVDASEAVDLMRESGFVPREPFIDAGTPWRCLHEECDREVLVTYSRVAAGRGCNKCSQSGYRRDKPGFLYFVTDGARIKGGIANRLDKRLEAHQRQGLKSEVAVVGPWDGEQIFLAERRWKYQISEWPKEWRLTKADLQDGYTESVKASDIVNQWIEGFVRELMDSHEQENAA